MSQPWGALSADPAYQALVSRIRTIERRFVPIQAASYAAQNRRFRLAATTTAVIVGAGATATVSVTFTQPFATTDYQVDVAVPALVGAPVTSIVVSNKTLTGCTIAFVVPSLIAISTTVIVLALSGPAS